MVSGPLALWSRVAALAAVGLSVGDSVGTGVSVGAGVGAAVGVDGVDGVDVEAGVWVSGDGVGPEQDTRAARVARMMIAGRSILCTWCFLSSLRVDFHSTCRSSRSSRSYCQESRGLGPIQYVLPPYFRSVFSGAGGSENLLRGSAGILGCLLQCS